MKHFGPQIDIHMGGEDLIFPHHQNEIAQTESCTGKEFSKYWIHSGHLMVGGKKMSKSLGNFYNLRDIEKEFSQTKPELLYRALRLSFISGKYRDTLEFNFDKLRSAIQTIEKIDHTLKRLRDTKTLERNVGIEFREAMQRYIGDFVEKLEDDFNTPEALAVFFEFQKYVSEQIQAPEISLAEKESLIEMYRNFNQVFAFFDMSIFEREEEEIPKDILQIFTERNTAKQEKNWKQADALRDKLLERGYIIKDTKDGAHIERK